MKIFLAHNYYKYRGGEDVAFDNQKNLLMSKGHSITEYSRSSLEIDNLFKKAGASFSSLYSFKTYKEVEKIIIESKPHIAHIHNIFPLISSSIYNVLYNYKIPIIQTIHNYRFFCANGICLNKGEVCDRCEVLSFRNLFNDCRESDRFYNFLIGLNIYFIRKWNIYSKIAKFIALSNFVKNKLVKVGINESRITVIRNIIPVSVIKNIHRNNNKSYFLYMGRLSKEKGVLELINIFSSLKGIKIKILGDGPLYNDIKKIIKRDNIDNIELLGYLDGEEKYQILNAAYALVAPSICYEISPLVIMESFKYGIPVIVNNIGSLPENIIDGKNGYIYNNMDELKNIVLMVASLSKKQRKDISLECKKSYSELFDPEKNFVCLTDLYKSIAGLENV